jgi:hypothetical protein
MAAHAVPGRSRRAGRHWRVALTLLMLAALARPAPAQTNGPRPAVWMGPSSAGRGDGLRELFLHPEQWTQTCAVVDVVLYADHMLNRQFSDDELRACFAALQKGGVRFALEVGVIKEWGRTGTNTFARERPMWERFRRLGANVHAMAMDEPLYCARDVLKQPAAYAVQETADFVALVRQHYPDLLIGDIETYPSIALEDHIRWIDALQSRLDAMHVRGLDFYRLDVNWAEFTLTGRGSWREVKKLELACRQRKLPFSLIYWAADQPALKTRGLADDAVWYVSVLHQGYSYALVGGAPDQYVIQSWVDAPSHSVPETGDFTFTRTVRDFVRKVAGPGSK